MGLKTQAVRLAAHLMHPIPLEHQANHQLVLIRVALLQILSLIGGGTNASQYKTHNSDHSYYNNHCTGTVYDSSIPV